MSLLPVFREALRRVDPEQVDHPYLHVQERVFCYELYHQLRLMEMEEREKGRELFHPAKVQAEVNKSAQAYFYSYFRQLYAGHEEYLDFDVSEAMPDLLIHQPGPNHHNRAVAEVKRAGGADKDIEWDLAKLALFGRGELQYEERIFIVLLQAYDNPREVHDDLMKLATGGPRIDVILHGVHSRSPIVETVIE